MSDLGGKGCIGHGRFAYDAASEARRRIAFRCHAELPFSFGNPTGILPGISQKRFLVVEQIAYPNSLPDHPVSHGPPLSCRIPESYLAHSISVPGYPKSAFPSTIALMPLDPNFGYATW